MSADQEIAVDFADSVGFVVDRCLEEHDIIGSGFLVDGNRFITLATTILPYSAAFDALKVVFPRIGKEYSFGKVYFHPQFNKRFTSQTVERTLIKAPELSVRKNNCAVVNLAAGVRDLSAEEADEINDSLSISRPNWDKGLSGSLDDIDLSLVMQTIASARKHGQLVVSDVRNRPLAKIFFSDGKIFHAQFRHLRKETAIYQLIASKTRGFFEFRPSKDPDWPALHPLSKPMDMLLLEAFRRVDELTVMRQRIGSSEAYLAKTRGSIDQNSLPPEWREKALSIWRLLDGLTPADRLWELVRSDEYEVYQALDLLGKTGQITHVALDQKLSPNPANQGTEPKPLPLLLDKPVGLEDQIEAVTVSRGNALAVPKKGIVVGNIDEADAWHLIHTAGVPFEGMGSPLIKDGAVVGMHCGIAPASRKLENSIGLLQQMLWIGSIQQCLTRSETEAESESYTRLMALVYSGDKSLESLESLSSVPEEEPTAHTINITSEAVLNQARTLPQMLKGELKTAICPICGSDEYAIGLSCPDCGYLPDRGATGSGKIGAAMTLVVVALLFATGLVVLYWLTLPEPNIIQNEFAVVAERPWLKLGVEEANPNKMAWEAQPDGKVFHNGDMVSFDIHVAKDSYVYLLYRGKSETTARLIYPMASEGGTLKNAGTSFTYPKQNVLHTEKSNSLNGLTFTDPPGDETIVALASATPLQLEAENASLENVFDRALRYLEGSNRKGVELEETELFKAANQASTGSDASGKIVFLTKVVARHT